MGVLWQGRRQAALRWLRGVSALPVPLLCLPRCFVMLLPLHRQPSVAVPAFCLLCYANTLAAPAALQATWALAPT